MAQVELGVLLARVPLVDADQLVVARVLREEAGCKVLQTTLAKGKYPSQKSMCENLTTIFTLLIHK